MGTATTCLKSSVISSNYLGSDGSNSTTSISCSSVASSRSGDMTSARLTIVFLPLGFLEVNPETVERNERMVDESAASDGGTEFVSITENVFGQRDCASRESGNFGHTSFWFPASDPFLSRLVLPQYSDSPEPNLLTRPLTLSVHLVRSALSWTAPLYGSFHSTYTFIT